MRSALKLGQRFSPLIVLAVVQLIVVLVAPSTYPGTASATGSALVPSKGGTSGASGSTPTAPGGRTATGSAAGGTATTAAVGAAQAPTGGAPGGATLAGAGATVGAVTSCPGTQPAPWTYMPPCLRFSGANGGATMPGVTSTDIRFLWFEQSGSAEASAVLSQTGLSYTPDQLCQALTAYTTVLNRRYELYGRHFVPIDGGGSHSGLAQGSNTCKFPYYYGSGCGTTDAACWRAEADTVAAIRPRPAFVIAGVETQVPFLDELARKGVLVLGEGYGDSFMQPRGPYVWDPQQSLENTSQFGSEYVCQKLAGKKVQFAGTEVLTSGSGLSAPTRKIAILHDQANPDVYGPGAAAFIGTVSKCGGGSIGDFPFPPDANTLAQDMQTIAAKIKLGGYTTVYLYCDFLAAVALSNQLDAENWHPEMVIAGIGAMDADIIGQLANRNTWQHAFGPSLTNYVGLSQEDCDHSYKDSGATNDPMLLCVNIWPYFWLMGDMMQVAGPSPTVASIQQGMFNLPAMGGDPLHATVKFGVPGDSYMGGRDIREIYWCANQTSDENGKPGHYLGVLGNRRFQHGQIDGTLRVFPNGAC